MADPPQMGCRLNQLGRRNHEVFNDGGKVLRRRQAVPDEITRPTLDISLCERLIQPMSDGVQT